jgi:hypothetical protein
VNLFTAVWRASKSSHCVAIHRFIRILRAFDLLCPRPLLACLNEPEQNTSPVNSPLFKMFVERRKIKRKTASERGVAVFNGVRRLVDITDISPRGAQLSFGARAPLPLRFKLVFASGRQVLCQCIWQRDLIAGVQFSRPAAWKRIALPKIPLPRRG